MKLVDKKSKDSIAKHITKSRRKTSAMARDESDGVELGQEHSASGARPLSN